MNDPINALRDLLEAVDCLPSTAYELVDEEAIRYARETLNQHDAAGERS